MDEAEQETEEETPAATTSGADKYVSGLASASKHEFNAEQRTSSHRLVATAMIITFLTVAISQNWWKHLRDFIATKTHGPAEKSKQGG